MTTKLFASACGQARQETPEPEVSPSEGPKPVGNPIVQAAYSAAVFKEDREGDA